MRGALSWWRYGCGGRATRDTAQLVLLGLPRERAVAASHWERALRAWGRAGLTWSEVG